jgi:hypothetical protein
LVCPGGARRRQSHNNLIPRHALRPSILEPTDMLANNARQLDLPNWSFQRRRNSLCADHHVVVAHRAVPEIRNELPYIGLQKSANRCKVLHPSSTILSEAD